MKIIGRLILAAVFAALTALLLSAAGSLPGFLIAEYRNLSRMAMEAIASVTGGVSFALWEALAGIILLIGIYRLFRAAAKKRLVRWLCGLAVFFCGAALIFTALWGLNHFGPTVGQSIGLPVREYTLPELTAAAEYYAAQLNECGAQVGRDENGLAQLASFSELAKRAPEGYEKLAQSYAVFGGENPTVKRLTAWPLYSRFGVTGYYICFTAEASVNPDTYTAWLPFTMCHELAHGKLIAQEDGANFAAYLACMENSDPQFRYSGALAAFVYCGNALHAADPDAYAAVLGTLDAGVLAELRAANEHYGQYEGAVQDAAQRANNLYLKAFSEEEGVQSYGRAADLLIAWFLQK